MSFTKPQWAQRAGAGTRIQQPWFVPSKEEYEKLYRYRDPLSLEEQGNGRADTAAYSPNGVTAKDIGNLRTTEDKPDGTWMSYIGSDSTWAKPSKGVWPTYAPPNQVSVQKPDESWYRRGRVDTDGPPTYCWEQFREYLRRWHLPADLYNAHRNGRSDPLHKAAAPTLGDVQYPEPDPEGPYTLDPDFWHLLEPEFRMLNKKAITGVVRVHPFPYRLTVEELSDWNEACRSVDDTRMQNTPWASVSPYIPIEPPISPKKGKKASKGGKGKKATRQPVEAPATTSDNTPAAPKPARRRRAASPNEQRNEDVAAEMKTKKLAAEDADVENSEDSQSRSTEDQTLEDAEEPNADEKAQDSNSDDDYDTTAKSPLLQDRFVARDNTLWPSWGKLSKHPNSRKLRTMGMKWRQQRDRRAGHGIRDAPPTYSDDETAFLQQWLDDFGTTFNTGDILRLFNERFSVGKDRSERTEQGLAEKLRRMAGSDDEKGHIKKPEIKARKAYEARIEDWKAKHCQQPKTATKRKRAVASTRSASREPNATPSDDTNRKRQRLAKSESTKPASNDQEESDSQEAASVVTKPLKIVISGKKIAESRALVAKKSKK